MVASVPAPGDTVGPFGAVELEFAEPLVTGDLNIALRTSTGESVSLGAPTLRSEVVVAAPVGEALQAGVYKVEYAVGSQDGLAFTGAFLFTFNPDAPAPSPLPAPAGASIWSLVLLVVLAGAALLVMRRFLIRR